MLTMCQVLYVSYSINSYLVDLLGSTVSIHALTKLGPREVKVTKLVISRIGPIFPNCLGGCIFTPCPYSSFTEKGEWANLDLISSPAMHTSCVVLANHLCESKFSHLANEKSKVLYSCWAGLS